MLCSNSLTAENALENEISAIYRKCWIATVHKAELRKEGLE